MGGFKEGSVNGWDTDAEGDTGADRTAANAETDAQASEFSPSETESEADSETQDRPRGSTASDIPWILRRKSITDGREQTVQLHLQESTLDVQRTQKIAVENRLGESVRKADLREAALLVGLQHTDAVVDVLEEWGYALE
ncbi:MAG: hypothetical protein ACOCUO_02425 [archaeon]